MHDKKRYCNHLKMGINFYLENKNNCMVIKFENYLNDVWFEKLNNKNLVPDEYYDKIISNYFIEI
jgi:hypothetical protein